ncbi:hypothetical protein L249_0767 [Ophiocordyceps polyrhachis-furcata BCC 54312]|uniref:Uncharacterized protein n=1 Tax=Ophiocordyceps polyrhachis-furcata BCC 54312 TaxID=1330021 RepID=A0A367LES0_9HYPO|nr:hypothetical protein L249_0767 [Ophiocordyceps polyrhachis-furcata BCC 54312]
MPVLGFSHGRCSSKPKELAIRKVSLSGCSLSSSSSSFDSTSSSANSFAYACSSASSSSSLSVGCRRCERSPLERHVDPLAQHPTYAPPPRLHDRRLLDTTTLYLGVEEEKDISTVSVDYLSVSTRQQQQQQFPRSRWSDSTIASVDVPESESESDGGSETSEEIEELEDESDSNNNDDSIHVHDEDDDLPEGHRSMPNFSYKRETSLDKRPPIKTLDSLDEFVKRGGWKRRGVIFHSEEVTDALDDMKL